MLVCMFACTMKGKSDKTKGERRKTIELFGLLHLLFFFANLCVSLSLSLSLSHTHAQTDRMASTQGIRVRILLCAHQDNLPMKCPKNFSLKCETPPFGYSE